ncbi:hypothetical protein IAU59_005939 [Kwoniella sp. CBS 9459]
MTPLLTALAYSDDLFTLPRQLLHTLSKGHQSLDTFIPMAIRAIAVAALFTIMKKTLKHLYSRVNRRIFPTAYVRHGDPAYYWVRAWVAQDPYALAQIHDFQLSTTDSRSLKKRAKNGLVAGHDTASKGHSLGQHNATWAMQDVIGQILPTYQHSLRIKHQGNYLWITRRLSGFAGAGQLDHLRIQTIAWRPNVLRDFLIAAHAAYFAKEERELIIFHAKRINPTWQNPVSRPARPWSSVILPGSLKDDLLKDIERFLSDKESKWYASRGIPHRRGYLFHGAPGAGKTTLVTAIASRLALDIYVINPSQRGMDDAKLSKLFRDCPSKSVILIEDIDCIFPRGRNHHTAVEEEITGDDAGELTPSTKDKADPQSTQHEATASKHDLAPSTVTMSGVLNAIDGVSSQEGCVLIATTNHPKRLDPALSRAGRFDIRVEFTYAVPSQARDLYLHFYPFEEFRLATGPLGDQKKTLNVNGGTVVIESQKKLDELADAFVDAVFPPPFEADPFVEDDIKVKDHCEGEKNGIDEQSTDAIANGTCDADAKSKTLVNGSNVVHESAPPTVGPKEPGTKEDKPKISMAALQGYLLQYKEDPYGACENAKKWVEEEVRSGKDKFVSTDLDPKNLKCSLTGTNVGDEYEEGSPLIKTSPKAKTNLKLGKSKQKKATVAKKNTKNEPDKSTEDAQHSHAAGSDIHPDGIEKLNGFTEAGHAEGDVIEIEVKGGDLGDF